MKSKTPTFFVVGAQKSGTTTLHDWLIQQPDVCLPSIKETHYFCLEKHYQRGIHWYYSQFPKCREHSVIGEVDPEYMLYEQAPYRIRELIKSPNLIFILRHPLDRAYSHYLMSVRRGYEKLTFKDALIAEPERLADNSEFNTTHYSYLTRSKYSQHINRYKSVFPESRFLFIKFDDLIGKETGRAAYERICAFIGIRSSPDIADRTVKSNQASIPRSALLNRLLYEKERTVLRRIAGIASRIIPHERKSRLWLLIDRINRKPAKEYNGLNESVTVPQDIWVEMKEEISLVEILTGLQLAEWKIPGMRYVLE